MATRSASRTRARIVVALDGPASSGKSSVGAAAAGQLGLRFVDTGLLYRAMTALALREGIATDDADSLVPLADRISLGDDGTGRLTRVILDDEDATDEARGPLVDAAVSSVAKIRAVREALLDRQRALAEEGGIVVAGRDIGTVVLPDADLKVFLDASVEERAQRRIHERHLDPAGPEAEAVREQLRERDRLDSTREVSPLRAADDAVHVRTDGNEFDETVEIVAAEIARVMLTPPAKPARPRTRTPRAKAVPDALAGGDAEAVPAGEAAAAPDLAVVEPAGEAPQATHAPETVTAAAAEVLDATPGPEAAQAEPGPEAAVRPPGRAARRNAQVRPTILETAMRLDNHKSLLVQAIAFVSRIGSRLFGHVEVEGLEHIPSTGPVILAANHISNADPVVLGAWITPALRERRIHWLGKRELFDWPVFGLLAAHGGVHPVDRDSADVEAFRLATRILEQGYVLLVFPEGTRSPTGALQEAKDGVAMLAMRTGAAIVPIGVSNTDAVWRKGQPIPLPIPRRMVRVRIGAPFTVADVLPAGTGRRAAKRLATTAIMARIAGLLEPRHRGVYADAIRETLPTEP